MSIRGREAVGDDDVVADAQARVDAFERELARLGLEDFRQVVVAATPSADREAARRTATDIAERRGLVDVLSEARERSRRYVVRCFDEGLYQPTIVGLNWGLSDGPVEDRVAAAFAVEDAVTAAVVEPFAPESALMALTGPFELISRGHPADTTVSFVDARPTPEVEVPSPSGSSERARSRAIPTIVVGLLVVVGFATGLYVVVVAAIMVALVLAGGWVRGR